MNSNQIKEDLFILKNRLESIETQLETQLKEIEFREEKWKKMDDQLEEILRSNGEIVKFNIGGKKFHTNKNTLLKEPDSLLARLVESERIDLNEELFFDRNPKYFPYILDYLRHNKFNLKRFKKNEIKELQEEVDYYEVKLMITKITGLKQFFNEQNTEITFVDFQSNGTYVYNGTTAGTNLVSDLSDKSLRICANTPGWIIIELNKEWEFNEIEIGGYNGNSSVWFVGNGASSKISTSLDKKTWKQVGTIPSNYGNLIQSVKLTRSSARYIKFENDSYCGLGYLKVKKLC